MHSTNRIVQKKKLYLLLWVLVVLPLGSCLTLDSGLVLNTTISNSSMTFESLAIIVDQAVVDPRFITLHNASFSGTNMITVVLGPFNWSTSNTNLPSHAINYLRVDTSTSKILVSNGSQSFQANLTIGNIDCSTAGDITYTEGDGTVTTFNAGTYSCSLGYIIFPNLQVDPLSQGENVFAITNNGGVVAACDASNSSYLTFTGLLPIFVVVFFAVLILSFLFGITQAKNETDPMAAVSEFDPKKAILMIGGLIMLLLVIIVGISINTAIAGC